MGELLGDLFLVRDQAHIMHLLDSNYKEHIILEEFYKDFLVLIDKFIESYIGYKKQKIYIIINSSDSESFKTIEELADFSIKTLEELKTYVDQSFLQSIIDDMIESTAGLLYKSKFL